MKRILLSALSLLFIGAGAFVYGQSARTVLVQHFTQASCVPCASNNPILEGTLNNNAANTVAIKHQVSWPGFDAMYNAYPSGPNAMVNYYNFNAVPQTVLGGTAGPGAPNTVVTNATIAARAAVPSPFDITLNAYLDPATQVVSVTMESTCSQAVSGNLRAHIAVVEKHLTSVEEPGGTNGETDFHNVLRQFLPNTNGTTLASSFTVGQTAIVNETWDFSNGRVSDYCDLAIVAYIQNNSTKEVHQAATTDVQLTTVGPLDAGLESFLGLPADICDGELGPQIKMINWGSATMTEASIDYSINGGAAQNHTWTGNLATCAQEIVTLPNYSFTVMPNNTLEADILTINSGADLNNGNDNISASVGDSPETDYEVQLEISTDDYANETWWEITDANGTIVASDGNENVQGNYSTGNFPAPTDPTSPLANGTTYNWTIPLMSIECYTFTIYDYYGDGMYNYGNPDGSWTLKSYSGSTLGSESGNFGGMALQLTKNNTAGNSIAEIDLLNSLEVYPNPFSNSTTIEFDLKESVEVSFNVINMLGASVHSADLGTLHGLSKVKFDGSNLEDGLYFFHFTIDGHTFSKRVTLIK